MTAIVLQVKASLAGPDGLHIGSMLALGLALGYPQLLEEDICRVEERRRTAGPRTLLGLEIVELFRLEPGELGATEVHVEVAAELGRRQARRVLHMLVDLEADLVAGVKDGDEPIVPDF